MLRFLKMTVVAGVPFGICMGLFFSFQSSTSTGIVLGSAAGLFFGLSLATFAAWQASRFTADDPDLQGEQLLKQGAANHFLGWEGVGGWLYLTDKRLLFRSHRINVQNHALSMPLAEMVDVQTCSTAWVVPNGLRVVTARGDERFVVGGRRSWVDAIRQAKG
jgi:hypothetical protein